MTWLFVLLFFFSIIGYYSFFKVNLNGRSAEFPLLFIAVAVVFTYSFGLIGLLDIGYYLFLLCGNILLLLTVYQLLTHKKSLAKPLLTSYISSSFIFMAIGILWMIIITRNVNPMHPDDFSHWLRICKVIHFDDSLPVTPEIDYLTYPPGTAVWAYIVTKTIGYSVGNCYFAQVIVNLAACCLFFGITTNNSPKLKLLNRILLGLCAGAFFVFSNAAICRIYTLTVDCVLGLVALAAIIFIIQMRDNLTDYISLIVLLVFLALIKIPGILFVLYAVALYLIMKKRRKINRFNAGIDITLLAAIPIIFIVFYALRNSLIYSEIGMSEQAFSIQRFLSLYFEKDSSLIQSVIQNVMYHSVNVIGPGTSRVKFLLASFAGLLCMIIYDKKIAKKAKSDSLLLFTYAFVCYWIFIMFLILTYIFSMQNYEAEGLGSYYRYISTISIMICGIFTYRLLDVFAKNEKALSAVFMSSYILIVSLAGHCIFDYSYMLKSEGFSYYHDLPWRRLSSATEEINYYNEDSYLIVWDESIFEDYSFPEFCIVNLSETYFRSTKIDILVIDLDSDECDIDYDHYDNVVIVKNN